MMTQNQSEKAYEICRNIISAFPKKSLDEFLDMVEYPAFQEKIDPKIIIAVAHQVYIQERGN